MVNIGTQLVPHFIREVDDYSASYIFYR